LPAMASNGFSFSGKSGTTLNFKNLFIDYHS
jgi:hypothetical protein